MSNQIAWHDELDDDDNTYWEGMSPFCTDTDPDAAPDVKWRLRQALTDNRIWWYACHDAELGGKTGDTWLTIEEAKAACQEGHDNICREIATQ